MKVLIRTLTALCFIIALGSCESYVDKKGELIDFIPQDPVVVFRIKNLDGLLLDVANNGLIASFEKTRAFTFFTKNASFIKQLHPDSQSVIAITGGSNKATNYTFITAYHDKLFIPDSIQDKTIETLTYGKTSLQRVEIDNTISFSAIKDSVFIVSSSQKVLQDILNGKTEQNQGFKKIFSINKETELAALFKGNLISLTDSITTNFSSWGSLQVQLLSDGLTATGVVLAQDSVPQLLSIFEGQIPQQNDIELITPREAKSAVSFTFSDAELLIAKLAPFRKDTILPNTNGLFESINEVGSLGFSTGNAVVLKSIDPRLTNEALALFTSEKETYREIKLNTFNASNLFSKTFGQLLPNVEVTTSFQIENFFVFTETEGVAQQIITAYKNNDCLDKTPYFETTSLELGNASSLLVFKMKGEIAPAFAGFFGKHLTTEITDLPLKNYPLAALQFSYDRDFAHVNLVCKQASEKIQIAGSVAQQFSISLDQPILGNPSFFSNHRTRGKDIVVQDIKNNLYLISSAGKVLWKKQLDGPVLGSFNEVDILKNGRKQLAFTTTKNFYVIDRKGKDVKSFPMKFKDPITQPLVIFDYDNNRNYRFVITQGNEVFLYDSNGKRVKGFTFKKTKSDIVLPPQHIRLGNKDYLLFAEESGKLTILNRVGNTRIRVDHKFDFSNILIQKEGSQFVVITKDNTKETISQSGKVNSQKISVSGTYTFKIKGLTKVTLDDNLLRINGNLVELPFGIYTAPEIFTVNRTTYITLTETQEKKVFVLTKSGTIVSGFPIYGSDGAFLGDARNNKRLYVVTKGESAEIILYGIE